MEKGLRGAPFQFHLHGSHAHGTAAGNFHLLLGALCGALHLLAALLDVLAGTGHRIATGHQDHTCQGTQRHQLSHDSLLALG